MTATLLGRRQRTVVAPHEDPAVCQAKQDQEVAIGKHRDAETFVRKLLADLEGSDALALTDANLGLDPARRALREAERDMMVARSKYEAARSRAMSAWLNAYKPRMVDALKQLDATLATAEKANSEVLKVRAEAASIIGDSAADGLSGLAFAPLTPGSDGTSWVTNWRQYLAQEGWAR